MHTVHLLNYREQTLLLLMQTGVNISVVIMHQQ